MLGLGEENSFKKTRLQRCVQTVVSNSTTDRGPRRVELLSMIFSNPEYSGIIK